MRKRILILISTLIISIPVLAQPTVTLGLGWRDTDYPADFLDVFSSSVLTNSSASNWSLSKSVQGYTLNGTVPGNAQFVLWLPSTNKIWYAVYGDMETGLFYTNSVTKTTQILNVVTLPNPATFYQCRTRNRTGEVSPFTNPAGHYKGSNGPIMLISQ